MGVALEKDVDSMINKVSAFYDQYNGVMNDIQSAIKEEKAFATVGWDIETIKAQHREFKEFCRRVLEVVGNKVDRTSSLLNSAAVMRTLQPLWLTLEHSLRTVSGSSLSRNALMAISLLRNAIFCIRIS